MGVYFENVRLLAELADDFGRLQHLCDDQSRSGMWG